jgi:hypothetical protein
MESAHWGAEAQLDLDTGPLGLDISRLDLELGLVVSTVDLNFEEPK